MPQRPDDLPDYKKPPLVEVALATQHRPLPLRQGHLGLFWSRVMGDYPLTQDLPPFEPPPAMSDDGEPMITLELGSNPRVNRAWFVGHDDTRLLQVQADRFVANWRSRAGDDSYPRFESILAEFSRSLETFDQVLDDNGMPRRVSEQVEVTYVNWVPDCALPDLLVDLTRRDDDGVPGIRTDERLAYRWVLEDQDPLPRNLQMNAHTARRKEGDRVIPGCMATFTFSAPVPPEIADDDVQEAMSDGRNTIVRAFTAVTTPEMHDRWGRLK